MVNLDVADLLQVCKICHKMCVKVVFQLHYMLAYQKILQTTIVTYVLRLKNFHLVSPIDLKTPTITLETLNFTEAKCC